MGRRCFCASPPLPVPRFYLSVVFASLSCGQYWAEIAGGLCVVGDALLDERIPRYGGKCLKSLVVMLQCLGHDTAPLLEPVSVLGYKSALACFVADWILGDVFLAGEVAPAIEHRMPQHLNWLEQRLARTGLVLAWFRMNQHT
ncbi:MAG: hypothetical protein ACJAYU_003433 [Bradymonadia bacterium]|jgi:hypothetical protein